MGGRVIKPEEIRNMVSDMEYCWFMLESKLDMLVDYLNSLVDSDDLKGKTAKAFKLQMQNHLSVINGILCEIYQGREYCRQLKQEVGFADLIEDDIIEQIKKLEERDTKLQNDIYALDEKTKSLIYVITHPISSELSYRSCYAEISRNELIIAALKRKLQRIDDIEDSIRYLFDTHGIESICLGIKALYEGFSNGDFTAVKYPSACYISYLGRLKKKDNDPRGIRVGLDEDFITVVNDDGTPIVDEDKRGRIISTGFGGNQDWDADISRNGCGVVAAVNTYLYLTGQTTITKSEYVRLCELFCEQHSFNEWLVEKEIFGALPWTMGRFIEDRCLEHGIEISTDWKLCRDDEQYDIMKEMLQNQIPVVWGLYSMENKKINLYRYDYDKGEYVVGPAPTNSHYVVATAIYEQPQEDGSVRRMVEVSSWGERLYIDYDEFLDFEKSFFQEHPEFLRTYATCGEPIVDIEPFINDMGSGFLDIQVY